MRLSNDALWLWLTLREVGVRVLDADRDELRERLACGEEPWEPHRVEAAIRALEEAQVLRGDGSLEAPAAQLGISGIDREGVLVNVSVSVLSAEEVLTGARWTRLGWVTDHISSDLAVTGRPVGARSEYALYWCETEDHDEDWFVLATCGASAQLFFEDAEGYDRGDCTVSWVAEAPEGLSLEDGAAWPSDEQIIACGGEFLNFAPGGDSATAELRAHMGVVSKAVRFGSRTYAAGDIVANRLARLAGSES